MSERAAPTPFARPARFCRRDAIPPSPPPGVLDAIGTATETYDELESRGRRMHFDLDGQSGGLTIQVLDSDGDVVGTVSPRELLDIAAGGPLD